MSMRFSSVYTFKQGIGTLSKALESSLRSNSNVEFKMNEGITNIHFEETTDSLKVIYAPFV
jgi:protoporphyrinogen/coproporphyrinogen III oxidase